MNKTLNARQERFCLEYIKDLNATEAAIRAGYSRKTAYSIGHENLNKPEIAARIKELQAELAERAKLKADDVIQELRALAFWSINDFISEKNEVKDISKLERSVNRPIMGIKTKKTEFEGGSSFTVELKLADKRAALVDLGRHLGIFKEDNEQKTIKIKVTRK